MTDVALSPPRVPSGPGGALDGWATRESPRGDRERRVDARGRHEHTRRAARVDATRDARTNERTPRVAYGNRRVARVAHELFLV